MASLWFQSALLPAGWRASVRVTFQDGVITSVEPDTASSPDDERHAIGLPGMCNVHSHAFQRGMAGLTERRGGAKGDDFWTWRDVMYRFLSALTPEDVEAIAAQLYAEMLETGFTRVGEFHYLHHDPDGTPYNDPAELAGAVARAASVTGIGLTLLPVFYAHSDFGGAAPSHAQRRFVTSIEDYAALHAASRRHLESDAVLGVAFHSLRAATIEEIASVMASGRMAGPVHIHVAEQVREVEACLAHHGARPVDWLLSNAPVGDHWCLVHATHISETETERLAASGAVAGLCPVTEANLGDGVFPAARYLRLGGRIGVGSDSNVLISASDELRSLEYSQRLASSTRCVLGSEDTPSVGRRLFDAAIEGGAQALGVEAGVAEGRSADIVALDATRASLMNRTGDFALDSWIFASRDNPVEAVWRRGVKVVERGRHVRGEEIAAQYRRCMAKLAAV